MQTHEKTRVLARTIFLLTEANSQLDRLKAEDGLAGNYDLLAADRVLSAKALLQMSLKLSRVPITTHKPRN